jgi:type I restriction enzyme, S subunit
MIKELTIEKTRLPVGWLSEKLDTLCDVEYGTRVVRKRDGGTIHPVYGGGGATFFMDSFNREDCLVVARFAMSEKCTRFVRGKFFLNDSGLSVKPKDTDIISQEFLNMYFIFLNDYIYSLARGAAQKNLNVPAFRKIEIQYPESLSQQQQIVAIIEKAFAAKDTAKANAEQNLQNAKELFESYLQNVFENKGDDWEEKPLGEVTSKIGSGATPRGGKASYKEEGISLIRSMNVHDFYFKKKNLAFIDDKQADALSNVTLQEKDVLLNITGASIARCCIIPKEYLPARVNQHVSIIRAKKDTINPVFLASLLTSKYFKDQILEIGEQGATRQAITKVQLENFHISYPKEIEEQEKVIQNINLIKAETKKLETIYTKKIADLEEMKKSVLQKAFSGQLNTIN